MCVALQIVLKRCVCGLYGDPGYVFQHFSFINFSVNDLPGAYILGIRFHENCLTLNQFLNVIQI